MKSSLVGYGKKSIGGIAHIYTLTCILSPSWFDHLIPMRCCADTCDSRRYHLSLLIGCVASSHGHDIMRYDIKVQDFLGHLGMSRLQFYIISILIARNLPRENLLFHYYRIHRGRNRPLNSASMVVQHSALAMAAILPQMRSRWYAAYRMVYYCWPDIEMWAATEVAAPVRRRVRRRGSWCRRRVRRPARRAPWVGIGDSRLWVH